MNAGGCRGSAHTVRSMGADEDAPNALLSVETLRIDISYVRAEIQEQETQGDTSCPAATIWNSILGLLCDLIRKKARIGKFKVIYFAFVSPLSLLSGRWVSWGRVDPQATLPL